MADEAKVPEEAPAAPAETPTETPETSPQEPPKEQTVGEVLQPAEPKPNLIPESVFLDEKKGRKEAERKVKELEARIAAGADRQEVSADIDTLLNEYGLDDTNKQFFGKLVAAVEAKAEARAEAKAAERLRPLEEKEKAEKLDQALATRIQEALETVPEFKGIANENVLKTLAKAPENHNKTFVQIIEDTYGSAVTGKRTIETTTPGGGKAPEPVDFAKAQTDAAYLKEVMNDPAKREQYNTELIKTLMG